MATSSSLRTLRTVGIVLVVIGAVAMVLGLAGYVSVTLHHAGIQCPGETSCVDRMMGHGIYGMLGLVGAVVAGVGGLVMWRAES